MRRIMLRVAYDGTGYSGWQEQENAVTIESELNKALGLITGEEISVIGASRTDAGVHARRQICSFRAETMLTCEELLGELRRYLPQDIGALDLTPASPRFHARLNCVGKTYLYRIWNSETPNVFERNY